MALSTTGGVRNFPVLHAGLRRRATKLKAVSTRGGVFTPGTFANHSGGSNFNVTGSGILLGLKEVFSNLC